MCWTLTGWKKLIMLKILGRYRKREESRAFAFYCFAYTREWGELNEGGIKGYG